jgi:hypothetical protein
MRQMILVIAVSLLVGSVLGAGAITTVLAISQTVEASDSP